MICIHKHPSWPEYTWDSDVVALALAAVRHKQGLLLGKMDALGFDLRAEACLNEQQRLVLEYLREENRVLREQLGEKRVLLNDDQRRYLAV